MASSSSTTSSSYTHYCCLSRRNVKIVVWKLFCFSFAAVAAAAAELRLLLLLLLVICGMDCNIRFSFSKSKNARHVEQVDQKPFGICACSSDEIHESPGSYSFSHNVLLINYRLSLDGPLTGLVRFSIIECTLQWPGRTLWVFFFHEFDHPAPACPMETAVVAPHGENHNFIYEINCFLHISYFHIERRDR